MKYRVTMNDGTVVDIEAAGVELASDAGERSVALGAPAYDAVDIEAVGLTLHGEEP